MKKTWLAVGIILLFIGIAYTPALAQNAEKQSVSRGNWFYVGGTGPGNYSRIQDAINDSSDGDTVFVFDDFSPYREFISINKQINLIGENKRTTIIEGYDWIGRHILQLNANGIHLHGFTIQNSAIGFETYYAIAIHSNNNDISGNILADNGGGVFINHSSRNKIYENNISRNRYFCQAITIWYGRNNKIYNNKISDVDIGISIQNSWCNKIQGNSLSQIDYSGVYVENSVDLGDSGPRHYNLWNIIYKNYISGAEIGMNIAECRFNFIYQNVITRCTKGIYRHYAGFIFVCENNFINNTCNANIFAHMKMNHWSRNYWDDWNGSGYYTIYGKTGGPWWYDPIEEYDKCPALKPYDIPGMR